MAQPNIPRRIQSLPATRSQYSYNFAALVSDNQFDSLALAEPQTLITVNHALNQAENAVALDQLEKYDQALLYYREAILSLKHVLYWEQIFTMRGAGLSTAEERNELKSIMLKYSSRVVEIGGSREYKSRPGCHDESVWSSQKGVKLDVYDPLPLNYTRSLQTHQVFTLATQLLLSMQRGAFITPNLFIPYLLWQQQISLPLASTKASYIDALIPHYNCLLASSAELRYNALETLNSIIAMLQSSLSKQDDHSDKHKLWSNVSPLIKGNSFTAFTTKDTVSSNADLKFQRRESHLRESYIDNIHPKRLSAGASLPLLSSTPAPPKRGTLKEKFKRLTQKPEKVVTYISSLVVLLETLLRVEQAREDRSVKVDVSMQDWEGHERDDVLEDGFFDEHLGYLNGVVFAFVVSDIEIMMQAYLRTALK